MCSPVASDVVDGWSDEAVRQRLKMVQAEIDRLLAEQTVLAGQLDARGAYGADGAINAANWLAHFTGLRRGDAARVARVARAVRTMPATGEHAALLGPVKVALLAGVATGRTAEAFADCEDELVRIILPIPVDNAAAVLQRWQKMVDQDGPEPGTLRRLRLARTFGGAWVIDGLLDDEGGATVAAVIDRVADQFGRDDASLDLADRRTLTQRRADAFVELVRRGAALPDTARAASPLLVLCTDTRNLDLPSATATTPDGATTIGAAALRLASCDSLLRRLAASGSANLDLGRSTRLVTPSQRLALEIRDGGCVFPGCARPSGWCDAHHLVSWLDGGTTDLSNLALLCRRHHRLHHHTGWTIIRSAIGGWTATHLTSGRTLHRPPREPPHHIPLPLPA